MEGSSPKTSSPTFAFIIASSIPGEGLVTVSDLKSMIMHGIWLQYSQFTPQIGQFANRWNAPGFSFLNLAAHMKEPSFLNYCRAGYCFPCMGLAGLYLLANFNRLFRGTIKNALLRRNVAAWLIIFLLNGCHGLQ